MTSGQLTVESAISEADSLQKVLRKQISDQVRSAEEKQIIKATAYAWFNDHRLVLVELLDSDWIKPVDDLYRVLLTATASSTLRKRYLAIIKDIKKKLGVLQADHVIALSDAPAAEPGLTPDTAPKFAPLISDPKMQAILTRRWQECCTCVRSRAPLAATVMMGGLLEGLLLAKINQLPDKARVFRAAAAPIDSRTGKALQLKEWGLKNFIDVAHELAWITKTTKDIGEVMRDYRNYIHPQKELSHDIMLEDGDSQMLWEVAKSITMQLLKP